MRITHKKGEDWRGKRGTIGEQRTMEDGVAQREVKQVSMTLAEFRDLAVKQLEKASDQKKQGSQCFKQGEIDQARECYIRAMSLLDALISVDACKRADFEDVYEKARAIEMMCHLNLAACALKEKNFEEALEESQSALAIDSKNVKALYRAGKALCSLNKFEDAVLILKRAVELSSSDDEILRLMQKAKKEMKANQVCQQAAFGGIFSSSSYLKGQNSELKADLQERRHLELHLKEAIKQGAEHSLIERWAQNGIEICTPEERDVLQKLCRRAAASGKLNNAQDRDLLAKHGVDITKPSQVQSKSKGKDLKAQEETVEILKVKSLTQKLQEQEALTDEEYEFLFEYKKKEIKRLREKLKGSGLTQMEVEILSKLEDQISSYEGKKAEMDKQVDEISEIMKMMNAGRRVPIRQRMRMQGLLDQERARLEGKDDTSGLSSSEWHTLQRLQKQYEEKQQGEKARREKAEKVKNLNQIYG